MRSEKRSARRLFVVALLIANAIACDSQSEAAIASADGATLGNDAGLDWVAPADGTPPTYLPTFYAVYYEILVKNCAAFCHASSGFFSLGTPELAYRTLVGVHSTSGTCGATKPLLVAPGDPDHSLLYQKITAPTCGLRMPAGFGGGVPLPQQQIRQIRTWIERGARLDGGPNERGGPSDSGSTDAAFSSVRDAARD